MNNTKEKLLDVNKRIHNFDEVVLDYTEQEALQEANRCYGCVNHPCSDGCPIHNDIPKFISKIKENKLEEAYKIISNNSPFPSTCSRVCPSYKQCQSKCTRGYKEEPIQINKLERFVCDRFNPKLTQVEINSHSVAVVGSGPGGLACAKQLASLGYDVTVYEMENVVGGILRYGIPEFRLPKHIVDKEIQTVLDLGVKIVTNTTVGKDIKIQDLLDKYDCVYLSCGAKISIKMNIKGEDLDGLYLANDFLYRVNMDVDSIKPLIQEKKVIVIGAGNVAMDAARSAIRLGAESVNVVYRRSFEEMPADKHELEQAKDEKIGFILLTNPLEILESDQNKGHIGSIKCIKMELGEPDEKGRRRPVEIIGSEHYIDADIVIEAISSTIESDVISELEVNKWGYPIVDDNGKTSMDRVYAGGDLVDGPSTVINAVKAGKLAANSINEYINKRN